MATPKDKSMITQRVIVDGREALLVLPQVWDEALGDWVVTDGSNRLPVEATIHADDLGVNGLPTKDDILAGKVDTLESTMQDVITEISNYKVIFPDSQTVEGSISVDNIPSDYPDATAHTELQEIKGKLTGKTEVTNLPDNQKVSDADVKAELEYINAKIDGKTEVTNLPETQNVKDDLVLSKLNDLETKIQATNDKLDGTINTQLTGSNVEDVSIADAVASADVEKRIVSLPTSRYKSYDFFIDNGLNSDVKIRFLFNGTAVRLVKNDGTVRAMASSLSNSITVPSGARNVLLSLFEPNETDLIDAQQWRNYKIEGLEIEYSADEIPTEGAITITLQGVLYNAE